MQSATEPGDERCLCADLGDVSLHEILDVSQLQYVSTLAAWHMGDVAMPPGFIFVAGVIQPQFHDERMHFELGHFQTSPAIAVQAQPKVCSPDRYADARPVILVSHGGNLDLDGFLTSLQLR
jgi:hypothetical protein